MKIKRINQLKLAGLIIFSTLVIFIKDIRILISLLGIILFLMYQKSVRSKLRERIKPIFLVGLCIILFQIIFNYSVDLSVRLLLGVVAASKIILLSLMVFFYSSSTSVSSIMSSLSFLPSQIQTMLTITFALIPSIFEESQKIHLAQSARGYNGNNWSVFKRIIPLVVPLLHRTLQRAQHLSIILISRGYATE
jgi:energy-coupling factor transporter transmembrane protein EcfT